jgi:gamma-glutamyltranspeptidase/glutathione hydrolase
MVVTANPYATRAALEILRKGGNAVDAAIVAQWVLNVVEPQGSGIGGGGFFVYFDAKTKRVHTLDGREKAPARTFPEMFLDLSGTAMPFYPGRMTGGLSVGVPGTLKLMKQVHERFGSGKFRFEELFEPAIELAEKGVPVFPRVASAIEEESVRLGSFESSRRIFFHPDGRPLGEGDRLVQKDLARTFRTIAQKGIHAFYEGEIAQAIVDAVQNAPIQPGLMEPLDLKIYEPVERRPLRGSYRGFEIFTMGPPSSAGVALIEILNILESHEALAQRPSADAFHLLIEAQKIAFEDRSNFLADPDFVKVPLDQLLSKEYAGQKRNQINLEKARPTGVLVHEASLEVRSSTTHVSIRDPEGNLVSYTGTIEYVFGSGMVVPGWGFVLNNELTDFDAEPGKANSAAPGKRPRSSMCPILVFREGKPFLAAGSPGGSLIIPTVQEVLTNLIDFQMPLEEAVAAPRFAARGGSVESEPGFLAMADRVNSLKARGHVFVLTPPFGNVQAILVDEQRKILQGASDPRGEGEALGY